MPSFDLHNNVKSVVAMDLQAIAADATIVGNIIDTQGFESIEFAGFTGTVTDGTYTLILEQGDLANLADAAVVPAAEVLGGLFSFALADDDATKRTGSVGKKRFIRATITAAGIAAGGVDFFGILAVLGSPHHAPVA